MPRWTPRPDDDLTPKEIGQIRDSLLGVTREKRADRDEAWADAQSQHYHPKHVGPRVSTPRKQDGRPPTTPALVQRIRRMLAAGHTQNSISRELGIARSTVNRIARGIIGKESRRE